MRKPSKKTSLVFVAAALCVPVVCYASAPDGRYTYGVGTVYDVKTGLTWERAVAASAYLQADAQSHCANLKLGNLTTGWRLPTRKELQTLVDFRQAAPASIIDMIAFPNTPKGRYWTKTALSGAVGLVWTVDFSTGEGHPSGYLSSYYLRCVHGP